MINPLRFPTLWLSILAGPAILAQTTLQNTPSATRDLNLGAGKSIVLDSPVNIQRITVANGLVAEAVAVTPREILINGKAPGDTSLIIWQQGGNRLSFDLHVATTGQTPLEGVRKELASQIPGTDVRVNVENGMAFVTGTVEDVNTAERALAISAALGKPVNLLQVKVPGADAQILLKVRFMDVDRGATQELGLNLFSTGAGNTPGVITTGQFGPPHVTAGAGSSTVATVADELNLFFFRPDLNLGATIRALQSKRLLQILAEPNVLATNGKSASFVAGGEFPYPTLQGGGAGLGAVTISFREFGVRINFTPTITPRGTIHLEVTPEVSSLDYANGLSFQGFTIPALATRRVHTEIELEGGQSFAIGGLLDNRVTTSWNKIPGLGDIPLIGKLFQSRSISKNNTELLVVVTAELVRPIPSDQSKPSINFPEPFLEGPAGYPRTPGMEVTGPVPVHSTQETMPAERLMKLEEQSKPAAAAPTMPPIQLVPVPVAPPPPPNSPPPGQSGGGSANSSAR